MLSSHTPLRGFERTRTSRASSYRAGAVNGSSARSVFSRRLNGTRSQRVVARSDNPTWPLRSSGFRALEGRSDQLRFSQIGRNVTRKSRPARLKLA
jgi:hypothetical protein